MPYQFGDLRSALAGKPGKETWEHLCKVCEGLEPALLESAIPYASRHLSTWEDDAIRRAPSPWVDGALFQENPPPFWTLARAIKLDGLGLKTPEVIDLLSKNTNHLTALSLEDNCICDEDEGWATLAQRLSSFRELDLRKNKLDWKAMHALTSSNGIERLERLFLARNNLGPLSASMLAQTTRWSESLRSLELSNNPIEDGGMRSLLAGDLKALESLRLTTCKITSHAFVNLAHADPFPRLTSLDLFLNRVDEAGFTRLVASPLFSHLEMLGIHLVPTPEVLKQLERFSDGLPLTTLRIGPPLPEMQSREPSGHARAFGTLMNRRALKNLTTLSLHGPFGGEVFAILEGASCHDQLTTLNLCGHKMGGEVSATSSYKWPRELENLTLCCNNLSDTDLARLFRMQELPRLEHLNLSNNNITDRGMMMLTRQRFSRTLKRLELRKNSEITARGLSLIQDNEQAFARLEQLDLSHCPIGAEGARILATSPRFSSLKKLSLVYAGLDEESFERLLASEHLTNIQHLELSPDLLGAQGVDALMKWPGLPRLKALSVDGYCDASVYAVLATAPDLDPMLRRRFMSKV